MRLINGSLVGLVLAGILAIAPTAAFAHGGGGGGHGGGGFGGGGHGGGFGGGGHGGGFGGGGHGGGFGGGGHGNFGGFTGHGFAPHEGAHFTAHGRDGGHYGHRGGYRGGGPYWGWYGDPYWYDYPYYGYYDYDAGDYSDAQASPSEQTIVAVQKELAKLGYYHGQIDGIAGPETRRAISWFQSVDKLSVSGQIDDPTLKALQIS